MRTGSILTWAAGAAAATITVGGNGSGSGPPGDVTLTDYPMSTGLCDHVVNGRCRMTACLPVPRTVSPKVPRVTRMSTSEKGQGLIRGSEVIGSQAQPLAATGRSWVTRYPAMTASRSVASRRAKTKVRPARHRPAGMPPLGRLASIPFS